MAKSRDAFRTISEVSDVLDTPAHVLRFWESKFKQIKPVKRAGGRRYYRPDDLALLAAIKDMLHGEGYSIKDAQKIIRETGVKDVVAQGHAIIGSDDDVIDTPTMPPRAVPPAPQTQSDLFAGRDVPDAAPPRIEITGAEAVPDPIPEPDVAAFVRSDSPAPETKAATPALPAMPTAREDVSSRILDALAFADPDRVRPNAAKITPLIARLSALRDEMRHPW